MQRQEVIDISKQRVSNDVLREVRRYKDRVFFEPRNQLYRINKDQAIRMVELDAIVSLGQYVNRRTMKSVNRRTMKRQVAGVFDAYSAIPEGSYYSWIGPLPEMSKENLESRSRGTTPTDWISRKRYNGFVVDGLEFNFHPQSASGGCMNTIDRCVEINWGTALDGIIITPKKRQSCFQNTVAIEEKLLNNYLNTGFEILDRGSTRPSQSRYLGGNLGAIPLTSYRMMKNGNELMSFFERFLGFTEDMIPYSEEAYQLQTFPSLHVAKNWSRNRILQEIRQIQKEETKRRFFEVS